MKKIFKIFLITIIFIASADAQQIIKDDTVSLTKTSVYDQQRKMEFYQGGSSFRISPESFLLNNDQLQKNDLSTVWLRTRLALMNSGLPYGNDANKPSDLLLPYYRFYLESKNISLLRKALGIAELGAVGYLAYKHLKKYGLFHKP